jgi:prevent-host-death family protein
MKTFNPKHLQNKLGDVFNAVQADGEVLIDSRSRPDMILMLSTERESLTEKIRQLTAVIKSKKL